MEMPRRGRPPLPPERRKPRVSGPSGQAVPAGEELPTTAAVLRELAVQVGDELRQRGEPCAWREGEPATWAAMARALGYADRGASLQRWATGARRCSAARLAALQREVARWLEGGPSGDD